MQQMFCSTFFAMTLSCSEQQVHMLTLSIIEQRIKMTKMKIKRQNIYEATTLSETEMGYSRKNPNRGTYFYEEPPGLFRFVLLP